MKEFFKNFKIPIILGGLAIIAVVATIIVVTGGFSSGAGLYITAAYGSVSVTNSDASANAISGSELKQGDVITVGDSSYCNIAYQGRKNSEDNYLVIGPNTQVVISGEFNGKNDSEIFIQNGTVIGNFAGEDKSSIIVRTSDSTITLKNSVSKIAYYTNEFISYTDLYTFMGDNTIQLYDSLGNTVNNPELQIEKLWGRIISEDNPSFEALNLSFDINELTLFDLKNLITIAQIVGEKFPYTVEELRAAYNAKGGGQENVPPIDEPTVTEPPVTDIEDNSGSIQTAEPVVTAPPQTETTLPGNTTTAPRPVVTQATQATNPPTQPQQTAGTTAGNRQVHIVTINIDGEETIQEVRHGENAVKPADPVIEGMTFVGWDRSFENITEDTYINALFDDTIYGDPSEFHIVTVVIGDKTTTMTVAHGQPANLPSSVEVPGYIFRGWDKDFSSITYDITITAILEKAATHLVTFVIEGVSYPPVEVEHGGSVMPPYIPSVDSNGNRFVGWDKSLADIINDVTITAVFATGDYHTVTFIIDNQFYSVKVRNGERAEPPFWPVTDSNNNRFVGWTRSLDNITEDVTITAIYGDY